MSADATHLSDDHSAEWREATAAMQAAEAQLAEAQARFTWLALRFARLYGLHLGVNAADPRADRIGTESPCCAITRTERPA